MTATAIPDGFLQHAFPAPLRPEIESLETSKIAEIFALGQGRDDLIRLWVGEGDLPTPDFICRAAVAALQAGRTHYPPKRGLPELRQAIAAYTGRLYDLAIDPERVSVTSSGMHAITMTLQSLVSPGDNVVVVSPIWPNIVAAVQIAGGEVRFLSLDDRPDGGFALDMERLEAAIDGRTAALFIASPGNPTGWVMSREEQQDVLALCRRRRVWLIADEVYARFIYDEGLSEGRPHAPSFLRLCDAEDPVIVVNSFSKAWAMTGWRLGWLIHPPSLGPNYDRLIEFSSSGAPPFLQSGALAALTEGEDFVRDFVTRCRRGGELVHQRLAALPRLRIARPEGAFYSFFALEGMDDSLAVAKQILARSGVGLTPGAAFGPGGEGHLRLCFASTTERLSEALERLEPVFSQAVGGPAQAPVNP